MNSTKRNKKNKHNKTVKVIYSDKDYNSNDGMLTSVWGPSAWHLLHTMSFNYPVKPTCDQKRHYKNFILSLKYTLPCGKCRINLSKNFKKLPLTDKDLESRNNFSLYIYNLHELVNKMLGKESGLSYETVRERYEHFRARCTKTIKEIKQLKKIDTDKGCVEPLYGEKSKCVLQIVPQTKKCSSFQIDNKCIKKRFTIKNKYS